MKGKGMIKRNVYPIVVAGLLVLLPGCRLVDWIKGKTGGTPTTDATELAQTSGDGSAVLATIEGKPLITQQMLDSEKQKLIASNPQLQAMISLMDEKQLNRNLLDGMASREVIRKYIKDNKLDQSPKYEQDFELALKQIRDALNTRFFMESFAVTVADNEIKKFYDENKDVIPNLLVSRGGVEARALSFSTEKAAKEFEVKAKSLKNDINRAAKEIGLAGNVKDFKLVNEQSLGLESELRDKIVAIKSVPSTHLFHVGKEYWVVAAHKKEAPKYRELTQVKDELKQLIEKEKTIKRFEEEVARLRAEYKVEIKEELFAEKADSAKTVQAAGKEDAKEETANTVKTADAAVTEATTDVSVVKNEDKNDVQQPEQKPATNLA